VTSRADRRQEREIEHYFNEQTNCPSDRLCLTGGLLCALLGPVPIGCQFLWREIQCSRGAGYSADASRALTSDVATGVERGGFGTTATG
jgi:hypothetical protein